MTTVQNHFRHLFEAKLLNELEDVGHIKHFEEGDLILQAGQYVKSMPLLLSGSIKVMRPDDDGNELLLYYLEPGDTCAMTLSCCTGHEKSKIHAITETPVDLIMIPIGKMEEWSRNYKTWRNFVFKSYHDRLSEMVESLDNVVFNNLDQRLEKYLIDKIEILNTKHIYITHKEIANDLYSNRVVISRLLKKLENANKIKLHRSFIEIV